MSQKAAGTSLGRYEGAKLAGDRTWIARQLEAAQGYQANVIAQLTIAAERIRRYITELAPTIRPLTLGEVATAKAQFLRDGLPQVEREVLHDLGFTADQIESAGRVTAGFMDYIPLDWQSAFATSADGLTSLAGEVGSWISRRLHDIASVHAVLPGFNSTILAGNDDGSTGRIPIGFTVDFFGTKYDSLFINNNGNLTFDAALGTFTPFNLTSTSRATVAPFFADVDTRVGNAVTYGGGTVDGHAAFGVWWTPLSRPTVGEFLLLLASSF